MNLRDARTVVTGAMCVLFMPALEMTIVTTALPAMMAELGHVELGSWVVTAYLLTSVCATPVFGRLSDMYGRSRVLRVCLVLFILGSIACGAATGMMALVIARACQGLGGGGLMTMAQSMVGDAVPPRERGRYAAYFSLVWMGAALLGPALGGVLADHAGWRWIFWLNVPLGVLAWKMSTRGLERIAHARRGGRIDYGGIVLLTLACTALLSAGSTLQRVVTGDAWALSIAIAAIVLTAAFVRQLQRAREPVIPPRFLHDAVIAPVLGAGFLVYGAYLALTVLVPLYFQVALAKSAVESGLLLVPMMATSSISALLAGRYTRTHGRYRMPPLLTLPVAIAATVLLAWLVPQGGTWAVTVLTAVIALGVGAIFPCSMVAAQSAAGPQDIGAVSGAIGLSRALGAALVTGLAMAVLLTLVQRGAGGTALANLENLVRHPLASDARAGVLHALGLVLWGLVAVLTAGLLTYMRVEERPLSSVAPHAK